MFCVYLDITDHFRTLFGKRNQQLETTAQRKEVRAEAFVAPSEKAAPTVEERLKKKRRPAGESGMGNEGEGGAEMEKRKRRKRGERLGEED